MTLMTRRRLLISVGASLFGSSALGKTAELACAPGEFRKFNFTPGEDDTCVAHSPEVQALLELADGEPEPLPQELVASWDIPNPQPASSEKVVRPSAPHSKPTELPKSTTTAEAPTSSLVPKARPKGFDRIVQAARRKSTPKPTQKRVAKTRAPKLQAPVVSDSQRSVRRGDRFIHVQNKSLSKPVKAVFFTGGRYIDDENDQINLALRDHYNHQQADMKRRLLVLMADIHEILGLSDPFFLVSGYRSPATNKRLYEESKRRNGGKSGVAKNSRHMKADAADLRAPGYSTRTLRRAAIQARQRNHYGGVGLYTASSFVHVDGGSARQWGT